MSQTTSRRRGAIADGGLAPSIPHRVKLGRSLRLQEFVPPYSRVEGSIVMNCIGCPGACPEPANDVLPSTREVVSIVASKTEMSIQSANTRRRPDGEPTKRVMQALEDSLQANTKASSSIMEQLRQCPEAFKVGEILGKAFDPLKYAQDGGELGDRYLPPAGVVIPPLV